MSILRGLPRVWRLPFGATVKFRYSTRARLNAWGEWGRWQNKGGRPVGTISIATDTNPTELLDTLYHEMQHALTDWHSFCIRPRQRKAEREALETAAALADENGKE